MKKRMIKEIVLCILFILCIVSTVVLETLYVDEKNKEKVSCETNCIDEIEEEKKDNDNFIEPIASYGLGIAKKIGYISKDRKEYLTLNNNILKYNDADLELTTGNYYIYNNYYFVEVDMAQCSNLYAIYDENGNQTFINYNDSKMYDIGTYGFMMFGNDLSFYYSYDCNTGYGEYYVMGIYEDDGKLFAYSLGEFSTDYNH